MPDHGSLPVAILEPRDGGRDGYRANGENVPADEAVDERAFPRLELAQNGHIDWRVLGKQALADLQLAVEGNQLITAARIADGLQQVADSGQVGSGCG